MNTTKGVEMDLNDIAPCGVDCGNCELHENNGSQAVWERVAQARGKTVEEVKCRGCRLQGGCVIHDDCETLSCVQGKGHTFCHECGEFPCTFLMPMKEWADRAPHNLKVYNLCRIKRLGVEKFLEEAPLNRRKYFTGKMKIGSGPQIQ
jgi:hypothetical protein